ncbi:unnamed protein product [Arctogadus glacialis]
MTEEQEMMLVVVKKMVMVETVVEMLEQMSRREGIPFVSAVSVATAAGDVRGQQKGLLGQHRHSSVSGPRSTTWWGPQECQGPTKSSREINSPKSFLQYFFIVIFSFPLEVLQ